MVITADAVNDVITSGLTTGYMFEFYPRIVPLNAVNYTLEA